MRQSIRHHHLHGVLKPSSIISDCHQVRDAMLMVRCPKGTASGTGLELPYLQDRAALAVVSLKVLRLCCKELQRYITASVLCHVQAAWEL